MNPIIYHDWLNILKIRINYLNIINIWFDRYSWYRCWRWSWSWCWWILIKFIFISTVLIIQISFIDDYTVGAWVGDAVGAGVGESVGVGVGLSVGDGVGLSLGAGVGES